jgi:hypothetical protein
MALINKDAPKFEATGDDTVDAVETAGAATATASATASAPAAAAPAPAASTSTAVAPATTSAVATSIMASDPTASLEDALRVDYDSLTAIMVTNGNVVPKASPTSLMGDHVGLELISFQNHWVCSPGGESKDEESKEFLKFSDDGKYVRGTNDLLTDAVAAAIAAGYPKAAIKERLILVGAMFYAGKDKKGQPNEELLGELVQIDLAPRSMGKFKAYRANAAYKVSKGQVQPEAARRVRLSAVPQSKGSNNWTDAEFRIWDDATDGK